MKKLVQNVFGFGIAALFATALGAQDAAAPETPLDRWTADRTVIFDAGDITLTDLVWQVRPLVVFADSPNDPQFQQQMALLAQRPDELAERDIMVIVDTDPAGQSAARLALRPRGYMMALIGKDGTVALRKPLPWDVRELSRSIDKMPIRQQEIRDRRVN